MLPMYNQGNLKRIANNKKIDCLVNIMATVINLLRPKIHILDTKWNNKWYCNFVCFINYCLLVLLIENTLTGNCYDTISRLSKHVLSVFQWKCYPNYNSTICWLWCAYNIRNAYSLIIKKFVNTDNGGCKMKIADKYYHVS